MCAGMGDGVVDNAVRNSETAWLHAQEGYRHVIDARVGRLVGLPVSHSEHPQVVRYPRSGGYYRPHLDTSTERLDYGPSAGRSQIEGERVATVLT